MLKIVLFVNAKFVEKYTGHLNYFLVVEAFLIDRWMILFQ
jgi:hypothetical protein